LATEADMALTYKAAMESAPGSFSATLLAMLQFAQGKSAPDLARCYAQMQVAGHSLRASMDAAEIDVLITPTTPQTAFAFGTPVPANQADLTSMANFAGMPALSLPCGGLNGLPVGLQLIARTGFDMPLLALAQKIGETLADEGSFGET
jgi:Asp-tRNA(Asn)/Glu-tRNA(Gln) amidotransferase A subunit family amidase